MNLGVAHYWLNIAILLVLGLAVLASRRWRRFGWFVCYALVTVALTVIYMLWFYDFHFYRARNLVTNLLALGAVVQLIRVESGRVPRWAWLALVSLVVVPFLPMDWTLRIYLPPVLLFLGQALALSLGIRSRNPLLLGMSIMGAFYLTSAAFKLFSTYGEVWRSLQILDPWFFTMAVTLMLSSVMMPSVLEHVRQFLASLFDHSYLQPLPAAAAGDSAVGRQPGRNTAVDTNPDVVNIHTRNSTAPEMDSYENHRMLKMLEEVLDRVDTMESAFVNAVMLSSLLRKEYLSLSEVARFLGASEGMALHFIEQHDIKKIRLTDDSDAWVVSRKDVIELLGDQHD